MEKEPKTRTEFINVDILDIRNIPQENLGTIHMVNVDTILYSHETDELIHGNRKIEAINVGQFVEASPKARLLMGTTRIDADYLKFEKDPLELLSFGVTAISSDVSSDLLEKKIKSLRIVKGLLVAPQALAEKVHQKSRDESGKIVFYDNPNYQVSSSRLVLDEEFLSGLSDQTLLIAKGALRLPTVLKDGLLKKKVRKIYAMDGILCHEENVVELRSLLKDETKSIKTIPAGYQLIEESLTLNNFTLENLKAKKLFCREWVLIDSSVDPKLLKQNLERLVADEQIFAPIEFKDFISEKVDWTRSEVVFYHGDMWLIDDDRTLQNASLESLKGKVTLVVMGVLKLAKDLNPTLFEKVVDKVHNFGSIQCPAELMQALKAKVGLSEGVISDRSERQQEHEHEEDDSKEETTYKSFVNVPYVAL
jgi:hypothetical protein